MPIIKLLTTKIRKEKINWKVFYYIFWFIILNNKILTASFTIPSPNTIAFKTGKVSGFIKDKTEIVSVDVNTVHNKLISKLVKGKLKKFVNLFVMNTKIKKVSNVDKTPKNTI